LLTDTTLTRHGKDKGTVKRTVAAFIDQIEAISNKKERG
jgi:hypothetical protein